MRRFAIASLILLLYGCTPSMIASKKAGSYNETIKKLAILVAEPGEMKGRGTGMYSGPASSKTSGAIADLNRALKNRLAPYFSAKGLPSETIAASEKSSDQYSHRLVVTPSSASASCYYMRCQATVRISVALQDSRSKAIVWTGAFDVPEASASHTIDDETANKVSELIWRAFQSENLVAVAAK